MRTYGIQASYAKDFHYYYTSPTGVRSDFGKATSKNIVLLWNPAMNVSFHLNYNPNSQSAVFTEASTSTTNTARSNTTSSWDLGVEYSF
jgi:hypothetical protein